MLDGFASFDLTMLGATENFPRRQVWKNIMRKMTDENLTAICIGEEEKLKSLKAGFRWIDMIGPEWRDIYGALYEESSSFAVVASETIKIEKDVHRTFGLFTKNIPLYR
jgi:hypothetical protein